MNGFDVSRLEEGEAGSISQIVSGWLFNPWRLYRKFSDTAQARQVMDKITGMIERGAGLFVARSETAVDAAFVLKDLPWDSDLFSLKMAALPHILSVDPFGDYRVVREGAHLALEELLRHARRASIDHISATVDAYDVATLHLLEDHHFRFTAAIVAYFIDLRESAFPEPDKSFPIRPYQESDRYALVELAREAFSDPTVWLDRAHADPDLPNDRCDELYQRWLENSIAGEVADCVLVAEIAGAPVGFITCQIDEGTREHLGVTIGHVHLNAVAREFRARGVYRNLVLAALGWLGRYTDLALIRTQASIAPVIKTWSRFGARLGAMEYKMHRWMGV